MNEHPEITVNAHSSIRIGGSKTVWFDPYLLKDAPHDADVVFITHDHYDHQSPKDIKKVSNDRTIVVTPENASSVTVDGLTFTTVPAYNLNKHFHPKEKNYVGYVVTMDGTTYYVTGDTDATPEMKAVRADVLLLPIGGTYTMTPEEAAEAAAGMAVSAVIPTHYGAIVGSKADGARFKSLVNGRKDVILKLFPGK